MRRLIHSKGIYIILFGLFILLQCRLWFEPDGIRDMMTLKKSLLDQQARLNRLKKNNSELALQVHQLQNNREATEAKARGELGMIKKGETFYQFTK